MFAALSQLFSPTPTKIFRQMGHGIAKRNGIFRSHWQAHQQHCFEMQQRWIASVEGASTAVVLGAGFLFDLDKELLARSFRKIIFVDGNDNCRAVWQKFAKQYPALEVEFCVEDVTTVLAVWKEQLVAELEPQHSWDDALRLIKSFSEKTVPASSFSKIARDSALLSLNILSQIPLAWQEIVERALVSRFGRRFVTEHEQQWIDAFSLSARRLVEQHLRDLSKSRYPYLLITDLEYCRYTLNSKQKVSLPCVEYVGSQWAASEAVPKHSTLEVEIVPALYGVNTEEISPERCHWVWNISPPGRESRSKGIAHLVEATLVKPKNYQSK